MHASTFRAEPRASRSAYVALAALAAIWGYTWIVVKLALPDASPYFIAAVRPALGTVALFVVLAATRRSLRPTPFLETAVLGLLQTTGFTLLQTLGLTAGATGKVALLAYTMPFWVALMAWPFLGERIAGLRWIALALAALGLAFVVGPIGTHTWLGDVYGIATGIIWAASAVVVKRLRARREVELLSLTAWQMLWGTIPLIAFALLAPAAVRWTPALIVSILFLGIASNAIAWTLWLFILSRLAAGVAGVASLATPVLVIVFAALQLHEQPSAAEFGGMACIVAALIVNALPGSAPATAPASAAAPRSTDRPAS